MTKKFNIIIEFIKDLSIETPNAETLIYVRNNLSKYKMNIDINSMPLKNKIIEVNTTLKFQDPQNNELHSVFEITYTSIVKINADDMEKYELQKILLCEVQEEIYPNLKEVFLNLVHGCGYKTLTMDKEINFKEMFEQQFNQK